jgi:hypothetical protein
MGNDSSGEMAGFVRRNRRFADIYRYLLALVDLAGGK